MKIDRYKKSAMGNVWKRVTSYKGEYQTITVIKRWDNTYNNSATLRVGKEDWQCVDISVEDTLKCLKAIRADWRLTLKYELAD